jgi:uncharacterized membrane protein YkoI
MEVTMLHRRACLGAGLCFPFGRYAWGADDNERARRAFQRGEIRSLSDIITAVRSQLGGEVIEVSFKREQRGVRGVYVYEFKVLASNGRVSEVSVDAATAKIIKREVDD